MSTKFKVGDKVRVIESALPVGHTGFEDYIEGATVRRVHLTGPWTYTIEAASGRETVVAESKIALQVKRDYVADHMRRTLRREAGMTIEQAAKFTANTPPELRGKYSRKLPGKHSTEFMWRFSLSFDWEYSPEGFDYWESVYTAVTAFIYTKEQDAQAQ